jgi:aminoglycoside phosphotransferase (APT) family kinase protein
MLYLLDPGHWDACMARPRAAWVPEYLRDRDRVQRAAEAMWDADEMPPHCLIHGDAHIGNMYFEHDGAPRFLDWQGAMRGHWAHDVTYFVVGALTVEDRRAHQEELLRHYLERLAAHGAPAPGFDDAWTAFRRHVMHGFFWVVNPEELQPEDVNVAEAERFSVAAADLEPWEILGV